MNGLQSLKQLERWDRPATDYRLYLLKALKSADRYPKNIYVGILASEKWRRRSRGTMSYGVLAWIPHRARQGKKANERRIRVLFCISHRSLRRRCLCILRVK